MVEIAKVLRIEERTSHPPVIILDEPTSVLESKEIETLFTQVRRLREFASVVFVSHRLDEVLDVCDRVIVLRGGQSVGEVPTAGAAPADLHRMMIGSDRLRRPLPRRRRPSAPSEPRPPRLRRARACPGKTFRDVDLDVRAGEIVGIVGVHGSGREDVCRALFGAEPTIAGEVTLDGEKLDLSGTRAAVRRRRRLRPRRAQDRGHGRADVGRRQHDPHQAEVPLLRARWWCRRSRPPSSTRGSSASRSAPRTAAPQIGRLSGGNQQKVVLARWLVAGDIRLLLLDHPTRGLDIGARSEVYRLMRELANSGVATVLLADSLEEAIGMSDRIIVMSDGRATKEVACPSGRQADPARPRQGDGLSMSTPSSPSRRRTRRPSPPSSRAARPSPSGVTSFMPVIALVALLAALTIADPDFLTQRSLTAAVRTSAPLVVLAAGATLVVLCGGIDLSIAALCSLSTVLFAMWLPDLGGLTILVVIAAAGAIGAVQGLAHVLLRIPSFIVTLGGMSIFSAVALVISDAGPIRVVDRDATKLAQPLRRRLRPDVVLRRPARRRRGLAGPQAHAARELRQGHRLLRVGRPARRHPGRPGQGRARSPSPAPAPAWPRSCSPRATSAAARPWPTTCCCPPSRPSSSAVRRSPAATARLWRSLAGALVVTLLRVGLPIVGVPSAWEQILYGAIIVAAVALTLDRSKVADHQVVAHRPTRRTHPLIRSPAPIPHRKASHVRDTPAPPRRLLVPVLAQPAADRRRVGRRQGRHRPSTRSTRHRGGPRHRSPRPPPSTPTAPSSPPATPSSPARPGRR